jgi:hypothetical protein
LGELTRRKKAGMARMRGGGMICPVYSVVIAIGETRGMIDAE